MKPIDKLKYPEKARLLFDLFPERTARSVHYIKSLAEHFQSNPQLFGDFYATDYWVQVAGEIQRRCEQKRIYTRSRVFSSQLFMGYYALFSLHCLREYAQLLELNDKKFRIAVELLF